MGGDLLDIVGKVRYIGVNSEQDGVTEFGAIKDQAEVDRLVAMVVWSPVDQKRKTHDGRRYFIAFHLDDGTVVLKAYWLATGELSRGIALPVEFGQAIESALRPPNR